MNEIVEYVKKEIDNQDRIDFVKGIGYQFSNDQFIFTSRREEGWHMSGYIQIVGKPDRYHFSRKEAEAIYEHLKAHNNDIEAGYNERARHVIMGMIK